MDDKSIQEMSQEITDVIVNGLSDKFKDHACAPKSEALRTTICRYAVKITDIYDALEDKPEAECWFDPVVIKPLMESDVYDPEMWLYTICGNMDNLAFLKELVRFILSAEDVCKQKALEAERLEQKREQVRAMLRDEGLM